MKIVAISDLHGNLPSLPPCDLVLIAGDICPPPYFPEDRAIPIHLSWMDRVFRKWLEGLNADVIAIGGNHDVAFTDPFPILDLPWTYLQDSGIEFSGLKIWGSPWTTAPMVNWSFDWNFRANENEMASKFLTIPNDTDILLTHAPPYTICDAIVDPSDTHVGSKALLNRLERLSNLKLHVFGHIHEAFGGGSYRGCFYANVAYVDEKNVPREMGWLEIEV